MDTLPLLRRHRMQLLHLLSFQVPSFLMSGLAFQSEMSKFIFSGQVCTKTWYPGTGGVGIYR